LDHVAVYGFLPFCLALLILHEHHRASVDDAGFRVRAVLLRAAAVAACLVGYGRLCALILGIAGAGSGWMTGHDVVNVLGDMGAGIGSVWDNCGGLDGLGRFLAVIVMFAILVVCALFAFIASFLLAHAQAVLLAIMLAVGKTCLTLELVPGL